MSPTNDLVVTTPSDLEIRMSRVFDAPRDLVFLAHSKCEHMKRWWGRGNPLDCEMDFRPGGRYRFVEHAPDGEDYAFRGEYLEIVEPEKLSYTFEFEGMPGHVCVDTLLFEEHDGKTTLTSTTRFDSVEDRDGMIESGMEEGANESMRALDALLATWK
ncbi:SRPBCC family protein [Saccharopolyspora erythraea]|uniref:SRPBCC family protein n=1 Tax=Saccharopolyspora erythraea TaxID=1836 RepID=UPI001BAD8FCF|nr:SRPBCC family protein [Saccharopolyspora erythraea]QUH00823.1 SRPBCC family protein [Saccharopolyspora erythraea]